MYLRWGKSAGTESISGLCWMAVWSTGEDSGR